MLEKDILKLKEKEEAVILAHNYQRPRVQDIADFVGDSLELALKARDSDARYIVFCGVDFMAEGAAMTCPDKVVLLPDLNARCPMAAQLPVETLRKAKEQHPDAAVVLYVNTLAQAKAEADVVCTSANCIDIVNALDEDEILFGPDANMAYYVQKRSNKKIIPVPDDGFCITHKHHLSLPDIMLAKEQHPKAVLFVHPECDPDVQDIADYILSTGGMVKKARELDDREFIIGTEEGLVYKLKKENPKKIFHPVDYAICKNMKLHTLEKVYDSLEKKQYVVEVPHEIAKEARKALERMFELTKRD